MYAIIYNACKICISYNMKIPCNIKKKNLVITTSNAYMDFIPYFKAEATSFDQEIIGETVFSLSSHLEIL